MCRRVLVLKLGLSGGFYNNNEDTLPNETLFTTHITFH